MRFVILGGGGIGSVVAAHLSRAGEEVTLVTRGEHLRIVAARGLEVRGRASFRVDVAVAEAAAGSCDLLIVATKTPDTAGALAAVADLRPRLALSLQNGVRKDRLLADAVGPEVVVGATTMLGATRTDPGVVEWTLDGPTMVGELAGGGSERLVTVVRAWNESGLRMAVVEDVLSHEWAKQAAQAVAPLAAITGLPNHLIWSTRPLAESLVRIIRETAAVAAALGVELSRSDAYGFDASRVATGPWEDAVAEGILRWGRRNTEAGNTSIVASMLQDVRAGRRTEVEETTGEVVRAAREVGVPTPVLDVVLPLVRGVERANASLNDPGNRSAPSRGTPQPPGGGPAS